MAKNHEEENAKRGGCFGKLLALISLSIIVGLGAVLYFIAQPQDLSDLEENSADVPVAFAKAKDIEQILGKAIEGDYSVTFSEKDLNVWLKNRLEVHQGGQLGRWISIKRVWVRLKDGVAELIIERDVEGHSLTTSMFIQVNQTESSGSTITEVKLHGGKFNENFPELVKGGRFGQVAVPQGFLLIVLADFRKLAEVFDKEIELGFQRMARIRIEEGRIVLDPHLSDRDESSF